jgi:hypothetical protein
MLQMIQAVHLRELTIERLEVCMYVCVYVCMYGHAADD